MRRYKFLREVNGKIKSNSGNKIWEVKKWYHENEIDMCNLGFHCSKEIDQAFSFVQGEILAEVEVKGEHKKDNDKEVYTDMRILKAWKWQKKDSVSLSIFVAELVLNIFEKKFPNDKRPREAIAAAKNWLKNPTAESAARAARSAASARAARSAWSELTKKIERWFNNRIKELEIWNK